MWNEFRHEHIPDSLVRKVYPDGIHRAIADGLTSHGFDIGTATLDEPEHGLTDEVLGGTDVLRLVGTHGARRGEGRKRRKIQNRVLHSGYFSKIFRKLLGTTCALKWREADEKERLWVVKPLHPIAARLPEYFELPKEEMYGEHFDIPDPDDLVFVNWFEGHCHNMFMSGSRLSEFLRSKQAIIGSRLGGAWDDENVQPGICRSSRIPGRNPDNQFAQA